MQTPPKHFKVNLVDIDESKHPTLALDLNQPIDKLSLMRTNYKLAVRLQYYYNRYEVAKSRLDEALRLHNGEIDPDTVEEMYTEFMVSGYNKSDSPSTILQLEERLQSTLGDIETLSTQLYTIKKVLHPHWSRGTSFIVTTSVNRNCKRRCPGEKL